MRSILDMDNIQIEVTNACRMSCSNCTRFCGHTKPYFMDFEFFKKAIDATVGYPKIVGIMGGEPLLHPQFKEMCEYALTKFSKDKLGLWSSFPEGYEHYRKTIVKTFKHVFLNDHTRGDIFHAPILVASEEVCKHKHELFFVTDKCWLQNSWSASINPRGVFFCEIAASMSILFRGSKGWPIEPNWWWRTPKDFKEQIEEFCPKCGVALPLPRRASVDEVDDISPRNLERLKDYSHKIKAGKYVISDLKVTDKPAPMAAYKDMQFRDSIAARYGMYLTINNHNYWEPHLLEKQDIKKVKSFFEELQECQQDMNV